MHVSHGLTRPKVGASKRCSRIRAKGVFFGFTPKALDFICVNLCSSVAEEKDFKAFLPLIDTDVHRYSRNSTESRRRNIMQVLRSIQTVNSDHISLKIPKSFIKRALEIIIIPIDDSKPAPETSAAWPKDFFARTAGCFAGTPLVREEQGEYEVRDSIR